MFGKVKRWLGIEGVKVELHLPDKIEAGKEGGSVDGSVRFYSMHEQTVKSLRVRLIEKYKRGRRGNKLVDEYTLGEISMETNIDVPAHEYIEVEFSLPFKMIRSDMDRLQAKNFLIGGVVKGAKMLRGVNSVYRVEAEADVHGTALNPFDTREVKIS